jgi:hypothetical protein
MLPSEGETPKFLQIYFVGHSEDEVAVRAKWNHLDPELIQLVQEVLHEHNEYVKEFKMTFEKVQNTSENVKILIKDVELPNIHKRRTNVPSVNEIAVVISGNEGIHPRDIVIEG